MSGRTPSGTPLTHIAKQARVPRGVARAAMREGLLPAGPLRMSDSVLLRVAAACLASPALEYRREERNRRAIAATQAILGDDRISAEACVLLTEEDALTVFASRDLGAAISRLGPATVTVLPVGIWRGMTLQRLTPTSPASTLFDDPFGDQGR